MITTITLFSSTITSTANNYFWLNSDKPPHSWLENVEIGQNSDRFAVDKNLQQLHTSHFTTKVNI